MLYNIFIARPKKRVDYDGSKYEEILVVRISKMLVGTLILRESDSSIDWFRLVLTNDSWDIFVCSYDC